MKFGSASPSASAPSGSQRGVQAVLPSAHAMLTGTVVVDGADIEDDLDSVYTRMGVCPQNNHLWDQLTGRQHLLFYGRLKNLSVRMLPMAC